jgi:hypothetical protein
MKKPEVENLVALSLLNYFSVGKVFANDEMIASIVIKLYFLIIQGESAKYNIALPFTFKQMMFKMKITDPSFFTVF